MKILAKRGPWKTTHSHAINLLINPTVKSKVTVFNRKRQMFNKLWAIKALEIHAVGKDVI